MESREELEKACKAILTTPWNEREGTNVPEAEDIQLGNHAATFKEAAVLYADMVRSTELVESETAQSAAEVYKVSLHCVCRVIRSEGGVITAFDGDRVMAVFLGESKRTHAVKCAFAIQGVVDGIIGPELRSRHRNSRFSLSYVVGVDVSRLFVARTGIRGANDLVWVGRAANYAAGLCGIRQDWYFTYITAAVYEKLAENVKHQNGAPMWEKWWWPERSINVYRSGWHQTV